ncbi:MAG TPA: NUDIX hydrolase [Polyangiaceae bacterium]|nr:NUDIX hydrolase [Polyangiaceae bacterium]
MRRPFRRDDGREREVYTLRCADWVNVVARDPAGRVLLVRQYRFGVDDFTLELPGGLIDPGEAPADAARRELYEETGHRAGDLVALGSAHPNPAIQGNRIHFFLAPRAEPAGDAPFDGEDEECEVVAASPAELAALVERGAVSHALCLAGLLRAGVSLAPPAP